MNVVWVPRPLSIDDDIQALVRHNNNDFINCIAIGGFDCEKKFNNNGSK